MRRWMRVVAAAGVLGGTAVAQAQTESPEAPRVSHPWQVPAPRAAADAYFTNLKSGDKIETPYLVKFGLSGGWGLAPVVKPMGGKSGHHHLLVNRDLPLNFKEALPFNDQYIHFGAGQMETVLTLEPGTYTLRMLLADSHHLPHFVYSKPTKITVTKKSTTDPKSLITRGIAIKVGARGNDGAVKTPFRVQFHASGMNVGHLSQHQEGTGHFKLTVASKRGASAEMDFVDGETETWLAPPAGDYEMTLEFVDNVDPVKTLSSEVSTSVRVQ
jgi:hypothetical protein